MSKSPSKQPSRSMTPFFGRDAFRSLKDEMDDLLTRFTPDWETPWLSREFSPSLDLSETAEALEARLDLPGLNPDEITIEVTGNVLRISGERKEEKEDKGKTYHRIERRSGSFSRTMTLPCEIQEEKVAAECKDGVLTITLPKIEQAKTRKVKIQSSES